MRLGAKPGCSTSVGGLFPILTLPGSAAGLEWYILKFQPGALTPTVSLAALGQVIFSLALGGTFMVVYGSYLEEGEALAEKAIEAGLKKVEIWVRGPGSGREAAVRALQSTNLEVTAIKDQTRIPHNGCRPSSRRRRG
mgnify:CR=1 FL=1